MRLFGLAPSPTDNLETREDSAIKWKFQGHPKSKPQSWYSPGYKEFVFLWNLNQEVSSHFTLDNPTQMNVKKNQPIELNSAEMQEREDYREGPPERNYLWYAMFFLTIVHPGSFHLFWDKDLTYSIKNSVIKL